MEPTTFATIMLAPAGNATNAPTNQWLVQLHPLDLEQGKIELTPAPMIIGRAEGCGLRLDDSSISRQHARIQWTAAGFEITDLGSTNGILVNDAPVQTAILNTGDRIRLGKRIFRFLADNDMESQYYETVYTMMTRDGLTGAFNKRYLLECLDREVVRSQRHSRPLAVIMFDIDHFKKINDTYGHLAGDEVLREVSQRIQAVISCDDVFARFGGEEFAIVVAEEDLSAALNLGERCRAIIAAEPFETSAGPLEVTISVGVAAPQPEHLSDRDAILALADARLYDAKRNGRNQVVGGH